MENTKNNLLNDTEFMEKSFVTMCKQGNIETVRRFLLKGINPDVLHGNGLHYAFEEGRLDVCELLIENGADFRKQYDFYLRSSVVQGFSDFVKYLISKGADVNANRAESFYQAYYMHTHTSDPIYLEIAEILINAGINVKLREKEAWLVCAEAYNSVALTHMITHIPNVNIHYDNEYALLKFIVPSNDVSPDFEGFDDMVKLLISKGADVHVDTDEPLARACGLGNFPLVKYLVEEAGADIHADIGSTKIFEAAASHEQDEILEYLEEKSAEMAKALGMDTE